MSARPRSTAAKAFDLLAAQPITAAGLTADERDWIVISAVADSQESEHVLSYFGNASWDLRPFYHQSNVSDCHKVIDWPADCPPAMVKDCKAVLYAWFKRGLPGAKPPVARGIYSAALASAIPVMRWLKQLGIERFDEVRPLHVSNFFHLSKVEMGLRPMTVYNRLRIFDLLWLFRDETLHPLQQSPWGNTTIWRFTGIKATKLAEAAGGRAGRTAIIPQDVQARVFTYCENVLKQAPDILKNRHQMLWAERNPQLIQIRDAALYILSITSGMRNEEAIGVESGSWRKEVKDGVEYHWVATVEHKTLKGKVEYLVPALTINALEVMREYAKPLQAKLVAEIKLLEAGSTTLSEKERLIRLEKAKCDSKKLFLCLLHGPQNRIDALSNTASRIAFRRLATAAGVDWNLQPHQCRRTYARMVVESKMGRASLIFLKWQLKHSSISMTQLYASNPLQDAAIFDEILQEMTYFKMDLIDSWLEDRPLTGGAGRVISRLRAIPIDNRSDLLAQTAAQVHIRATGHGWCLAEEKGCGGAGLYETTRCAGCKSSVIDETFLATWRGILDQQKELLAIADAGPAVQQRALRELRIATQVMKELGVTGDEVTSEQGAES
ncbi:site-specific integrase [Herbaspirillum sp. ST 5-3]|uniref:site-specific integrase n=1 Tax=Oxalobacteraceae TaxID=75682 RepID=UPI0010A4DEC4|nr:site-specific integrase [Herbaspirillum sp. ST 5-3]